MESISAAVTTPAPETPAVMAGFLEGGFLKGIEDWQILLAAAVLLVLVIVLVCALISRSCKIRELKREQKEKSEALHLAEEEAQYAAEQKEEELREAQEAARQAVEQKEEELRRTLSERQEQMDEQLQQKDKLLDEAKANALRLQQDVDELTRFRDEYAQIPSARAEAGRIISEAKDHAYVVSNRAEMEYAEIIEHAHEEAESIRAVAQERLTRSHAALRAALTRANEIVEEAHAQANRFAQIGGSAASGLIDAPVEDFAKTVQAAEESIIGEVQKEETDDGNPATADAQEADE